MKYSKNFERDYSWYLEHKDEFNFDGALPTDKVIFDEGGEIAKLCFYHYDSSGRVFLTREPELLHSIYKCKGSINFHIKLWAEDRAKGILPSIEFKKIAETYDLLPWMIEAVEQQKFKYYEQTIQT